MKNGEGKERYMCLEKLVLTFLFIKVNAFQEHLIKSLSMSVLKQYDIAFMFL